jgi:hypothetical protein
MRLIVCLKLAIKVMLKSILTGLGRELTLSTTLCSQMGCWSVLIIISGSF